MEAPFRSIGRQEFGVVQTRKHALDPGSGSGERIVAVANAAARAFDPDVGCWAETAMVATRKGSVGFQPTGDGAGLESQSVNTSQRLVHPRGTFCLAVLDPTVDPLCRASRASCDAAGCARVAREGV